MKINAVILARAKSKGIPNKNMINFCGKPLLAWTIEQCLNSDNIGNVWVSSDGDDILNFSKKLGCLTIKRPESLASDYSSSEDGWLHAIEHIEMNNKKTEAIIVPQATSPLRKPEDFNNAINTFFDEGFDSLFSCSTVKDLFFWKKNLTNKLESINYDYKNRSRRQENQEQYIENGSFYVFNTEMFKKVKNRFGNKIGISKMEFWQTFEIDSMDDIKLCSTIMENFLINQKS